MGVNCKINGQPVSVDAGTSVLEAARGAGFEVPHFCWHPGLSRPANCRMCLVDASNSPKPIPSCYINVAEGVDYTTDSEHVRELRRAILEFILLNHPIDCAICDQAGECELQNNYFDYSLQTSRLATDKVHKPKAIALSDKVTFDGERCIVCTRCVRFCDEVAKTSELGVKNRGERSEIAVFPGKTLSNPYSMNVIDLCPVGALTSTDFRFKCRVWFMSTVESVCDQCSRGCAVYLDHHKGEVMRYRPRENREVNDWWVCDSGRMSYATLHDQRVLAPVVRDGARPVRASIETALERTRALLGGAGDRLAVLVSATLDNETLFALRTLRAKGLAGAQFFGSARPDGSDQDDILLRNDKNPNRRGREVILGALPDTAALRAAIAQGQVTHVLALGGTFDAADVAGATVVAASVHATDAVQGAAVVLPLQSHAEHDGSFVNFSGQVQRFQAGIPALGEALAGWELVTKVAKALGHELGLNSSGATLKALARELPEFSGFTHISLGSTGRKLGGGLAPEAPAAPSTEPTAPAP
jgi:NADH-quinone oxidoreductase subunit G